MGAQIKILGCYGGIGGAMRTTALLVDDDVLIDAGTGVGDLSLEALCKIDHIFITHTHLDHIAFIPLLLDTVMGLREKPVTLHASAQAIETLKQHIFNWHIWPDFNVIPNSAAPYLVYRELHVGDCVSVGNKNISVLPANHVVPAVSYQVESGGNSLIFTGDTAGGEDFWRLANQIKNLKYLIIETAFSNSDADLAALSKHLCPATLSAELAMLNSQPEVYITHLKPGEDMTILKEIAANPQTQHCKALRLQQVFNL